MRMPPCSTAICAEPSTWPCWVKTHGNIADRRARAEDGLLRTGAERLAIADPHDIERLARRHYMHVPGAGVVGVAMGDQGPFDGLDGIDIEAALLAKETLGRRVEQRFRFHACEDRWQSRDCQLSRRIFKLRPSRPVPMSLKSDRGPLRHRCRCRCSGWAGRPSRSAGRCDRRPSGWSGRRQCRRRQRGSRRCAA